MASLSCKFQQHFKDHFIHKEMMKENCGQCYTDLCGDCAAKDNRICIKSKCRKDIRYQPFTSCSSKKLPVCDDHIDMVLRETQLITSNKNHEADLERCVSDQKYRYSSADLERCVSDQKYRYSSRFIVRMKELKEFFKLTEDKVIQEFFQADSCKRIADKYLIAMVFAYFKRANFSMKEYTRLNFFICLYLANDMEEDEEEIKYEIFPWVLGKKWKDKYVGFLRKKDLFLRSIGYKAIVSRRCCDEIMAIEPDNAVWKRERPLHHGGALRTYMRGSEDDDFPRGPGASPRFCSECDAPETQRDSESPTSSCWYMSSSDVSSTQESTDASSADLDFSELRRTLPRSKSEDIWPAVEE